MILRLTAPAARLVQKDRFLVVPSPFTCWEAPDGMRRRCKGAARALAHSHAPVPRQRPRVQDLARAGGAAGLGRLAAISSSGVEASDRAQVGEGLVRLRDEAVDVGGPPVGARVLEIDLVDLQLGRVLEIDLVGCSSGVNSPSARALVSPSARALVSAGSRARLTLGSHTRLTRLALVSLSSHSARLKCLLCCHVLEHQPVDDQQLPMSSGRSYGEAHAGAWGPCYARH